MKYILKEEFYFSYTELIFCRAQIQVKCYVPSYLDGPSALLRIVLWLLNEFRYCGEGVLRPTNDRHLGLLREAVQLLEEKRPRQITIRVVSNRET